MASSDMGIYGFKKSSGSKRGNWEGDIMPEGYSMGQIQQYDPQQMELYGNSHKHLGSDSYLSKLAGGDQGIFDEIEAPAWRDLQEAQGGLASRFSGMGMGGRGSAFQNAATQQSSDFAMKLQAQRHNLRSQAIKDLMGLSSDLLDKRPYERFRVEDPEDEGVNWTGIAGGVLGGVGGFFATGGNPMGAFAGASTGYNIGSGFSGRKGNGQTNDYSPFINQNKVQSGGISTGSSGTSTYGG